eukprot:gnl/MRDRNA2_/MRDRNA2_85714_c1_seq1.p1 gnl/MRDRNA2_/MRDRNA2_85714_c1~~gnl/MRDRNA2_/MRDRNA2_85714_c1_seq1.p1  ORF type:complete len:176 (+),score=42.67 gnl/MRDRNA2_/MRDRNA2_85714_c1_seq1:132-659(+)
MMQFTLFLVALTGSSALSMKKTQANLDASKCNCNWASTAACAPDKDDGSDCMTLCCSTFMQALNGDSGPGGLLGAMAAAPQPIQAVAVEAPTEEPVEERLRCDCSWVLQGGCNGGQGDGSPCAVKCCQAPPDLLKSAIGDFGQDIKDKIGGAFGKNKGPTPAPGSAIKVEIPVWR